MKKMISRACSAALVLALLTAPAAQAAGTIGVELDDVPLAFTDAVPLAQDGRTYLPFRALFEAMGAGVEWDAATQTVTAVRDGRTVRLTLGQTAVAVEEDGKTTELLTDAAPFARGGRTYVPVRFAAQAFDAVVDWDAETRTVHIVDADKLLDEYEGSFTLLQKMLDTAALAWPDTAHRISGSYTSSALTQTSMGDLPVTMTGTFTGTEDGTASAFSGDCKTDIDALRAAIVRNEGDVIDTRIEALLTRFERFSFSTILNYDEGVQYLRSDNLSEFGLSAAGGWAEGELPTYTAPLPDDARDYVLALAADCSLTGSNSAVEAVEALFDGLSDGAPGADGGVLEAGSRTLTLNGSVLTIETALGEHTARTDTLRRNARAFTLTSENDTRTSGLTCEITVRSGGEAPAHHP